MKTIFSITITFTLSFLLLAQVSIGTDVINESAALKIGHGTDNQALVLPIVNDLTVFTNDTTNNRPGMIFYDGQNNCIKFLDENKSVSRCILTEDQISTPNESSSTNGQFNVNNFTAAAPGNVVTPITVAKNDLLDRTTLISFTTIREYEHTSVACALIYAQLIRERIDTSNNTTTTILRTYEMGNTVTIATASGTSAADADKLQHPLSFTYYDEMPSGYSQKYYIKAYKDSSCNVRTNFLINNNLNLISY